MGGILTLAILHLLQLNERSYYNEVGLNLNFEIENEEENDSKIVKRKTVEMKPMDEEEAILQTELLDHDFFVFKNVNEECVSVLYKRKDGKYGILNVK